MFLGFKELTGISSNGLERHRTEASQERRKLGLPQGSVESIGKRGREGRQPWQDFLTEDEAEGLELEDKEESEDRPPAFLAGLASGVLGRNCVRYEQVRRRDGMRRKAVGEAHFTSLFLHLVIIFPE